jgi:hypothetical protein
MTKEPGHAATGGGSFTSRRGHSRIIASMAGRRERLAFSESFPFRGPQSTIMVNTAESHQQSHQSLRQPPGFLQVNLPLPGGRQPHNDKTPERDGTTGGRRRCRITVCIYPLLSGGKMHTICRPERPERPTASDWCVFARRTGQDLRGIRTGSARNRAAYLRTTPYNRPDAPPRRRLRLLVTTSMPH